MAFGIDPAQVVDAEVVGAPQTVSRPPPRPGVIHISQAYQNQGVSQPVADQLALTETRARAITLFARVPFMVFVALQPKLPPLVRLGAGVFAAWDLYQIASQEKEIESMFQVVP